jgi:protein-L-isoaspartate O-methyltransferase
VGAGVPVAQGWWIVGDALLEVEQRAQIDAVLVDRFAMDVPHSITEQQER